MNLSDSLSDIDPDILKLVQSNKTRREYIDKKKAEVFSFGTKRAALSENAEEGSNVLEESPKRQCTGLLQTAYSKQNKENIEMMDETTSDFVPYSASKTRGLAALKKKYSNDDEDDVGYLKATEQQVNNCNRFIFSTNSSDLCAQPKQKSRLADLAANIKEWEDDIHTPTLSSKNVTSSANTTKFQTPSVNTTKFQTPTNTPKSTNKTFSMKVYYTNKQSSDTIGNEKHDINQGNAHVFSSHGKGTLDTTPACKVGNINVGSVKGKWEKLQAWDQAVMATLETPTNSSQNTLNLKTRQDVKFTSDVEDHSGDESINEDDYAENYDDLKSDNEVNNIEMDFSPSEDAREQEKSDKLKVFESVKETKPPVSHEIIKTNVDPAELPLSARKALFENAFVNGTPKINDDVFDHKMSVAQRAAMFENATKANSGVKSANFREPKRMAFSNFEKFEKRNTDVHKSPVKSTQSTAKCNLQEIKASPVKQALQTASPVKKTLQTASPIKKVLQTASPVKKAFQTASPVKQVFQTGSPVKKVITNAVSLTPSPTKNVGNHTRLIQQKLMESTGSNWQEKQTAKVVEERKKEISSLVNHWEKLSSSSSAENNSELEKAPLAPEEKVSYESDTVYEATTNEEEFELNDSENEYLSDDESKNVYIEKESEFSDYDDEQDEVDSIAEKAENKASYEEAETGSMTSVGETSEENFHDVSNQTSDNNTRSFTSSCYSGVSSAANDSSYQASNSQSCSSSNSVRSYDFRVPQTEEVFIEKPEKKENKNPEINLLRTVSAYRREKQETKLTPVRTIVRKEKVSSPESPPDVDFTEVIQQRLKELQEEVLAQQTIIRQTSQALNLCSATAEFSGSTEQVEGERLLLIATQKRQACLNEIQRLKTCGAQGENLIDGTGTLTITDLQLPLKREFIASQVEGRGNDTVHYFLCLIRHGAQVIVTQMVSTDERNKDGTLSFTNHIQLRNLPADFSIVFEVYALQTKKEVLPHEKKYHIKRENSKRRLTPKGKKIDGKMPAVCSPGGPNAVRSPSFGVVGFTRFNLSNCNKNTFTLDKVPFTSPLEGILRVQIQLHAEHRVMHRGFLTFYEDVGDIGALYRRWCVLDGSRISYWLYPEDEHKEKPVGSIDLKQCVTGTVKSVSTLECARSHTFKLVTIRPQKKGDKNTLISKTANTITTTKHLLTADTKDERILWCNKINEALENVRKWDPQALRPIESINI